jgi:ABC-type branched-subunit amino acid transport system substrate-binding protein
VGKSSVAYEGMKTVSYNQGTVDFIKSIQQKYNIDNVYGSAAFYDFVSIVIEACENLHKEGQKTSAEEITAYIHNKKQYQCASGECLVNPNGFILNQPIVRIYEGNDWKEIAE